MMKTKFDEFLEKQENELPRQPVPSLEQTHKLFLSSSRPLLTENEFKNSVKIADEFFKSDTAKRLQQVLLDKASKEKNWLSRYWLNAAYMDSRNSLINYSNIGGALKSVELTADYDYLNLTAAVISGTVVFIQKCIYENSIPTLKIGPYELCNSQTKDFFTTCRIPGLNRDYTKRSPSYSKHFIVIRNNHFFKLPVYDNMGNMLNQQQLLAQLKYIEQYSNYPNDMPIGVLTTENRATWFKARQYLIEHCEENRINLDLIETAIIQLSIDKALSKNEILKAGSIVNAMGHRAMNGGSFDICEGGNRFIDKPGQFIISESGVIGFGAEHSPIEVNHIFFNNLFDFWLKNRGKDFIPAATGGIELPKRLDFKIPKALEEMIPKAYENLKGIASNLEINAFWYQGFGKDFVNNLKIGSPDSFIQIALQFTFYKIHKEFTAQYETAITRIYLHGRTETIRSCTLECINFIKLMSNQVANDIEKGKALKKAMDAHKNFVMIALQGQGVDRHLLGLRLAANEHNIPMPDFFKDNAYAKSTYMRLSTSQVPIRENGGVCLFAPLVNDGYGVCYIPLANEIDFGITTYNNCSETDAKYFSKILGETLDEMKNLALRILPLKKL